MAKHLIGSFVGTKSPPVKGDQGLMELGLVNQIMGSMLGASHSISAAVAEDLIKHYFSWCEGHVWPD